MKIKDLKVSVVTNEFLEKIENELKEIREILKDKSDQEFSDQWIESIKIPKLLGVSQKTWQTYRDTHVIPFSQFGRKIWVRREDLEQFMESNYIKKA